jgi:hypothetical protein
MPVTINLPTTVDVTGYNVELFGETVTLSGDLITVKTPLSRAAFYNNSTDAYMYYIQDASENRFDVYTKGTNNAAVVASFKSALNIAAGATYDKTKRGSNNIQAPAAFADIADVSSTHFHSLQDFIIGYFAWKVLGHPGAVAAISNDSTLRSAATLQFNATADTLLGANILTTLPSEANVLANGAAQYATAGAVGAISMDELRTIVEQMMAQDYTRFDNQERNKLNAVEWQAGDKVRMQLKFNGNSYSVSSSLSTLSPSTAGTVSSTLPSGAPKRSLNTNDYYVLEFTLA